MKIQVKKIKAFLLFSNKTQNIVMTFLSTLVRRALNNQNKNREKKRIFLLSEILKLEVIFITNADQGNLKQKTSKEINQ